MEGLDKWYVAFITYFDTNIFAMEYEIARTNLEALKKWYEHRPKEMNEADTRFHLIDELLVNCLGWQKDDIKSEQSQDSEYADYTLYISERRCFIIEAKRISNTFELPAGLSKTEYKLSSLVRDNPEFAKAIDQVIGYCNKRGVEFAAVSNGHQIIGFLASRNDGVAPLDGNAIVFSSLQSMCANFLQMWNTFSRTAIAERRLILQLQESTAAVLPLKLLSQIYSYPRIATRNDLQADLQVVSEVVLENVNKHEDILDDFLKDTYCNSGTLSQYALISKSILTNRYALLFDDSTGGPAVKEAVTKKGVSPEVFAESLSSSPILLLGDVGSGKTMFINYFLRI